MEKDLPIHPKSLDGAVPVLHRGATVYLATLYAFSTTTEDREDLRATRDKLASKFGFARASD